MTVYCITWDNPNEDRKVLYCFQYLESAFAKLEEIKKENEGYVFEFGDDYLITEDDILYQIEEVEVEE